MKDVMEKLKILSDSAKFDVSCSSSGVARRNNGKIGNAADFGICHTWSADGRCISLLKVLFTNKCVFDCEYCINRRSADVERASFEPEELAKLTIEFYRRNYIEGLFLSSAVDVSPDHTAEKILRCLRMLRKDYGFAGYIHAKMIPGTSPELIHAVGLEADRVSVNIEMPSSESLSLLAPQKKPKEIFSHMRQITNTLIERKGLKGPGTMFKGQNVNDPANYLDPVGASIPEGGTVKGDPEKYEHQIIKASDKDLTTGSGPAGRALAKRKRNKEVFAPAGQTTQMIIGAAGDSDYKIMKTSEALYRSFKMKRVYFSAYVPVVQSAKLPDPFTAPPLKREHRLYQADWLLRFYGFGAEELFDDKHPDLDLEVDPKISWALRNIHMFPVEINKASFDMLLRVPGIGTTSALRIVRQRRLASVSFDDLKRMGVVVKRARFFITCRGKYYGENTFTPEFIRDKLTDAEQGTQMSMFDTAKLPLLDGGTAKQAMFTGPTAERIAENTGERGLADAGLSL